MQQLSHFATTIDVQTPVFVAVLFDAATNTPQFALIQESPTDIPIVKINGAVIETRGLLQDCTITVTRPTDSGGIIRRSCSLDIQTEHSKGYAFFKNAITKKLYYGGQRVEDVYFAIYCLDRQFMFYDLLDATFLGMYQIETGVSWTEIDGKTTVPLTEMLINDVTIVGATDEVIPETLFLFNPWFDGQVIPKVYGQVPRIRMLNSFPTIGVKDIAGSINGIVQADYTSGSSTIILESNTDQSSVLRQLAIIGGYVRIKMADGEVIKGTLVYNSGTNQVSITVVTRNTYYADGRGYTFSPDGQTPANWGFSTTIQKIPTAWNVNASVILHAKDIIQDIDGWMQADVEFYVDSTHFFTETRAVHLTGWEDEDKGIVKHETFTKASDPTNFTALSFDFVLTAYGVVTTPIGNVHQWTWAAGEHLNFRSDNVPVKFYFRDPATATGGGHAGDQWQLVGYEPGSISYECYVRNGFSHFLSTNVYCEGDGRLIRIPDANVLSVTDSTTVGALANMAKIVLSAAPIDMGIGATSNIVYTDACFRTGTNENRTERILYEILKESTNLVQFAGDNITGSGVGYATANWLPYIGYVARGDDDISAILDKICFECGATFKWSRNKFWIRAAAFPSGMESDVTIGLDTYTRPNAKSTDELEMLENTAKISFGKLNTAIDGNGYEYIPMYLEVQYGSWEDPFYKPAKPIIQRAIKPNERRVTVKFSLINDASSAKYATGLLQSIGHSSGASLIQRSISTDMTMKGVRWEAMDPIVFKDFPLLSTSDETNANLDLFGYPRYLKPVDGKRFLMGALAVVDQVEYQFSILNPKVVLTAKMSQTFTAANGAGIYSPPYPPQPPNVPSNNPANPPGGGGGGNGTTGGGGSFGSGGDLDPMSLSVSGDDEIEIDSTAAKTASITITVDSSTGSKGPAFTTEILDDYHTGGATLDVVSGSFSDKVDSTYVPGTISATLTVTYVWMSHDTHSVNRPLTIKFAYHTPSLDGTSIVEEFAYHTVNVKVKDLFDIAES